MRGWIRPGALALLVAAVAVLPAAADSARPAKSEPREVRLAGPAGVAFVELGRLYGVRVVVEPTFPARALRLRLSEADFASALRAATRLAGAFAVEQPDGSVLVAEDTPANRARYLPQVMKTFVLPGRTSDELTDTIRLLREVLDMNRILPDAATSTFTVRDTPERLAVAEALLEQLLAEPGEIWLDVEILEVDRNRARELGLVPPDTAILQQIAAGALPLTDAGALADNLGVVLPGAELRLQEVRNVARAERHLSLRAREGQDATLFAGDLFPVTFTTFSSSFISPVEQELRDKGEFVPPVPAMRYEELGVRIHVQPRLHSSQEVTLALTIDQKALAGTQLNDIPVLSNRSLEHQVRVRTGETLVLGGLRTDSRQTTTRDGFLQESRSAETTELLVLVTPRIVREPRPDRVALRALYVGTESEFAPAGAAPARPSAPSVPQPPGVRPPTLPPAQPPAVRPPAPQQPSPPEEEEEEDEEE